MIEETYTMSTLELHESLARMVRLPDVDDWHKHPERGDVSAMRWALTPDDRAVICTAVQRDPDVDLSGTSYAVWHLEMRDALADDADGRRFVKLDLVLFLGLAPITADAGRKLIGDTLVSFTSMHAAAHGAHVDFSSQDPDTASNALDHIDSAGGWYAAEAAEAARVRDASTPSEN